MNDKEDAQRIVQKYGMKVPEGVVSSILTSESKPRVLMARAAFRADAVRTAPEFRLQRERRNLLRNMLGLVAVSIPSLLWLKVAFFTPHPPAPAYVSNPIPLGGELLLANASSITTGQSLTLEDPNLGPMLLIHLQNGQFVAYSAFCTHAGCTVQFDPYTTHIECPCHGAVFDPSNNAQVLAGPAPYPLQRIPTRYDQSSGNIYLTG